ncbi:MAG: ribosomal protein L3 N(5)-glutamine methyltransferase [Legionellales bacterium RIFCSPHIGHO2_12_FULL_37_14]|nr:MAG: ribosomal protein L3 N(5)-glutamine methyltransferase [Legionellales bacterium RIFCSPHIGHO2_12_FULL_37_14]
MQNEYSTAVKELKTVADFLRFGLSKALAGNLWCGHGTDNVQDDIWALVLRSLKLPFDIDKSLLHTRLLLQEKRFLAEQLKSRIINKVPVPYLINEAYFAGLDFYVDERVIIPRSPIAEAISQHFNPWVDENNVKEILDLCTGSACIAIACAYAFQDANVDAIDISKEALEVATINVERHKLKDRVKLILSNLWDKVPPKKYDLIISNPPYVSKEELRTLPKEYAHEPKLALEAKNNGLEFAAKILKQAADFLRPNGVLVLEVGNSAEFLAQRYRDLPFVWLDFANGGEGVCLLTKKELARIKK